MSLPIHIGKAVRMLFDRGDLPERVRCTKPGLHRNEILTWGEPGCYRARNGDCLRAGYVRNAWGVFFHDLV
jgi:hypothetical protein